MQHFQNQSFHEKEKNYANYNDQQQLQKPLVQRLKTRQFWLWLSPVIIAVGLMITVIILVSQSVTYFQSLFGLINNQLYARVYLKQYYTLDMAMLYLSIIAFMVVMINSLIYATKFILDKTNLTYFHAVFLLTYIAVGVVMFVKKQDYAKMMAQLAQESPASANCTNRLFECLLSQSFADYLGLFLSIFIAICVLFLIFMILFHLNVKWELEKSLNSSDKKDQRNNESHVFNSQPNNLSMTQQFTHFT